MNDIFYFLKVQECNNELGKNMFPIEKNGILNPWKILGIPQNF